jgi:coenzyme PQQ precursor peptide PqqA
MASCAHVLLCQRVSAALLSAVKFHRVKLTDRSAYLTELNLTAEDQSHTILHAFKTRFLKEITIMTWQKPQFEEISLNCEINSYAPAEL